MGVSSPFLKGHERFPRGGAGTGAATGWPQHSEGLVRWMEDTGVVRTPLPSHQSLLGVRDDSSGGRHPTTTVDDRTSRHTTRGRQRPARSVGGRSGGCSLAAGSRHSNTWPWAYGVVKDRAAVGRVVAGWGTALGMTWSGGLRAGGLWWAFLLRGRPASLSVALGRFAAGPHGWAERCTCVSGIKRWDLLLGRPELLF